MKLRGMVIMSVLSVALGILIGYVIVEVEVEDIDVKRSFKQVVNKVKGEKLVIIEGLNKGDLELVRDEYNGEYYYLVVQEEFQELNHLIKRNMLPYYRLMVSAFKKEEYEKKPKENIRLLITSKDSNSFIGLELSKDRLDSIEKNMGTEFMDKHLDTRGWDLLNNVDMFWMSDDLKERLEPDLRERINWDLERAE